MTWPRRDCDDALHELYGFLDEELTDDAVHESGSTSTTARRASSGTTSRPS